MQLARAFNHVYDLKLTVRGEMEFAYLGEIATPSKCGEVDGGRRGMGTGISVYKSMCEARARGRLERPVQAR